MNKPCKAFLLGLAASLFFAVTFIVNRMMSLDGGSWVWSASLRFFWMLPFLLIPVLLQRKFKAVWNEIKSNPLQWLLWSTVGFGVFYAPLTFAAAYSPSWLVASTWQFTIIAGIIVAPLITPATAAKRHRLLPSLLFSGIILGGIILMQAGQAGMFTPNHFVTGILPVLVAAFAYPLGNRKMMQLTRVKLDVFQRILGMLLCSLPFWVLLSVYEITLGDGLPVKNQYFQTLVVALCSGVVATALFFRATYLAGTSEPRLAAVEATQSAEVLFALVGELVVLGSPVPGPYAMAGILLVICGMVLHTIKGS